MSNKLKKGDKALSGKEEYLEIWYFKGEDSEKHISSQGASIMVWDPAKENDPPYWVWENTTSDESTDVPKGFVVRVIKAWVKFI